MRRIIGLASVTALASAGLAALALGQLPASADKPSITASPNPLVFPTTAYVEGSGPCPSSGSGSGGPAPGGPAAQPCSYAVLTVTNRLSHTQTISHVEAPSPFFTTTFGTCYGTYDNAVPKHSSCTIVFGFQPTASNTSYSGTATIGFGSDLDVSVELEGTSD